MPFSSPEPNCLSCASNNGLLEMMTKEPCEGNCKDPEESRSLAVTANCSACEWLANPADARDLGPLPGCISPIIIITLFAFTAHVPHEATTVPADLGQPTPSPSCPLSRCCHEAVNLNQSPLHPPTAGTGTEPFIPPWWGWQPRGAAGTLGGQQEVCTGLFLGLGLSRQDFT